MTLPDLTLNIDGGVPDGSPYYEYGPQPQNFRGLEVTRRIRKLPKICRSHDVPVPPGTQQPVEPSSDFPPLPSWNSSEVDAPEWPLLACHSSPRKMKRKFSMSRCDTAIHSLERFASRSIKVGGMAAALITTPHRSTRFMEVEDIKRVPLEPLTSHRLTIRQKQIDYGKNTKCYDEYLRQIPKDKRSWNDPQTPDIHAECSRRSWDGQIKKWRRILHMYDPTPGNGDLLNTFSDNADDGNMMEVNLMQSILANVDDAAPVCNIGSDEDDIKSPFLDERVEWASLDVPSSDMY